MTDTHFIQSKTHRKTDIIDEQIAHTINAVVTHRGLFQGRLRRKDFIIGILFFFGLGFIFLTIMLTWIQYVFPEFWSDIQIVLSQDTHGSIFIFIPFIFAPITVMLLSLIARRLHNLSLPRWIAFCYLLVCVSPFAGVEIYSILAFHILLLTLFIVLVSKKGHPAPNTHGLHPPSVGSIFGRILGYETTDNS